MSEIICITNRALCDEHFTEKMKTVISAHPDRIILREKDMSESGYKELAGKLAAFCLEHNVRYTLHTFYRTAREMNIKSIHLPLHILRSMTDEDKSFFEEIGTSCHSTEDALQAQELGAAYIIAGHIFETDCKAGLPGRGLEFLRKVKNSVSIPVYAVGGISAENAAEVISAGADGICIMSGFMKCIEPSRLISELREAEQKNG